MTGVRKLGLLTACGLAFTAAVLVYGRIGGHGGSEFPPLPASLTIPHVDRGPEPLDMDRTIEGSKSLAALPKLDRRTPGSSIDLRWRDLTKLDLRNSQAAMEYVDFDSGTVWPAKSKMPPAYSPARVSEIGRNPGLGIRRLHAQGVTGRGSAIAIIDHLLLTGHVEYAQRLRWYEELGYSNGAGSSMHGAAVASIAVGKTVGVAPGADLYYLAYGNVSMTTLLSNYAKCIKRLLEINARLPKAGKIRAISMSIGYGPETAGYPEFIAAVREAEAEGIFVTWCGDRDHRVYGLAVPTTADRDDFTSYGLPSWYSFVPAQDGLFMPMDHRTTASPSGVKDYAHWATGGYSWIVPYLAGAYALAAQVDPNITPKRFWELARITGRTAKLTAQGKPQTFGPILDMPALIGALRKEKNVTTRS